MTSILFLAIGIAVAVALFGSMVFQSLTPINDAILSPLEKKCQRIADQGYKIQATYPGSNPDELPEDDMKQLMYLDEIWMNECVSSLPADKIIDIANNVDRDFSYGE
ncbi:MAG: hypothetical protein ACE5GR_03745 [Nitrosopumilus sp.]